MQKEVSESPSNTGPAGGRRPLVIPPDNSRMLRDIKNSLSHVRKPSKQQTAEQLGTGGRRGSAGFGIFPIRPEWSKSTPNIYEKVTNEGNSRLAPTSNQPLSDQAKTSNISVPNNVRRNPYRKEELQMIAKSLAEYHIDPLSDGEVANANILQLMQWNEQASSEVS